MTKTVPIRPTSTQRQIRRVEYQMGTAVTLAATIETAVAEEVADRFFDRIDELEALLSRFRPGSQLCRVADGRLDLDDADPDVRRLLTRCDQLRHLTRGSFEHEPRRRSADPNDPVLDPNALAKGWIIDRATMELRLANVREFFVNAGGDIVVARPRDGRPWRIGVRHPRKPDSVLGVLQVTAGAIATSGTYERGDHIRLSPSGEPALISVSVVGPELGEADALATAVFASGQVEPTWWDDVDPAYGLLTVTAEERLRWQPPRWVDRHVVEFEPATRS